MIHSSIIPEESSLDPGDSFCEQLQIARNDDYPTVKREISLRLSYSLFIITGTDMNIFSDRLETDLRHVLGSSYNTLAATIDYEETADGCHSSGGTEEKRRYLAAKILSGSS